MRTLANIIHIENVSYVKSNCLDMNSSLNNHKKEILLINFIIIHQQKLNFNKVKCVKGVLARMMEQNLIIELDGC